MIAALAILRALWALVRTPWGAGVVGALALVAALAAWGAHRERQGRAAERAQIERLNMEARDATFRAYRSVDDCYDAGGVWSVRDGRCRPGVP